MRTWTEVCGTHYWVASQMLGVEEMEGMQSTYVAVGDAVVCGATAAVHV